MTHNTIPWLFAAATAVSFGLLAHRAQRLCILWAFGGGLFALVITTIVFGLSRATFLAISRDAYLHSLTRAIAISLLLLAVFGWLFTTSLHKHHLPLWNALKARFSKDK